MEMVLTSTCDVCGVKGTREFEQYFPGYRMPDPHWQNYVPKGWQYVQGVTLCPSHTFRIVIERVGWVGGFWREEIEPEPGAKAQPFQRWMEKKS